MTDLLEARAPTGTHTILRKRDSTETPKQIMGTKKPDQSDSSACNAESIAFGVLRFFYASKEHSIAPSGVEASLISSPLEQGNAIVMAPGADFIDRLRHVLHALPPVAPGEDFVSPEVVERILSCDVLIAAQRARSSTADRRYDCFRGKLIAALLDEPIEDGVTHPAERVIDEALRSDSSECRDWLSRTLVENYPTRPSIGASIVRCVGRMEYGQVGSWGMHVANDALQHKDVEVREAAVRALEAWGISEALDMLRRHEDAESWLSEYVRQVIADLSRTTS